MKSTKDILSTHSKYVKTAEKTGKIFETDRLFERTWSDIPGILLIDPKISHGAKILYLAMRRFSDPNGHSYPGHERLGKIINRKQWSIIAYQKELEKTGWLKIKRRGLGRTNYYYLDWPANTPNPKLQSAIRKSKAMDKR